MKSYCFKVSVEPDGDKWHAHCPALEQYGAATWGNTEKEAYRHIQEVIQLIIDELLEDGILIPEEPERGVHLFAEPQVVITV